MLLKYQITNSETIFIQLLTPVLPILEKFGTSLYFRYGKAHQHSFGTRHLSAKQAMLLYCGDSQILVLVLSSIGVSVIREDKARWREDLLVHDILGHDYFLKPVVEEVNV